MIHALELRAGRAAYRNRWVVTAGLRAERRAGRAIYGSVKRPFPVAKRLIGADGDHSPVKNAAKYQHHRFRRPVSRIVRGGLPYALDANSRRSERTISAAA